MTKINVDNIFITHVRFCLKFSWTVGILRRKSSSSCQNCDLSKYHGKHIQSPNLDPLFSDEATRCFLPNRKIMFQAKVIELKNLKNTGYSRKWTSSRCQNLSSSTFRHQLFIIMIFKSSHFQTQAYTKFRQYKGNTDHS